MYQLVFKGQCTPGQEVSVARANMAQISTANQAQLDRLFSGERVIIRSKLDHDSAIKYQAVLKEKGILVHIEAMPADPGTETQAATSTATDLAPEDPQKTSLVEPGFQADISNDTLRIGILGAGQLGRMLALAGYPLDQQFVFYDLSGSPTAGIGEVIDDSSEGGRLEEFLEKVDRVTYEFEHLPLHIARKIAARKPLMPGVESLRVSQNRGEEKALFDRLGIPTAAYRIVANAEELAQAAQSLGCPVIAKSLTEGYDGKGQALIRDSADAADAWQSIGHEKLLVEAFVNFERELSIVAVRGQDGDIAVYPMAENVHVDGILRYSFAPAPNLDIDIGAEAERIVRMLLNELDHVGVLTLELFETKDGLVANEMAPRVHNSGHWTIEGATTSQFENHLRAVAGLPLGSTEARLPACMINIIGKAGDSTELLRLPYVHLHRYGKEERRGRKIGHVTVLADSYEELVWRVRNCASLLPDSPPLRCSLYGK